APLSDADLKRVKRQILAGEVFAKEGIHALAEDIAVGVTLRGLEAHKKSLAKIESVTAADVKRVATTYLDPKMRVTVASKPKPGGAGGGGEKPRSQRQAASKAASSGGYDLTKTQKIVLPNGMTLLLLENHRLPLVAAQAFIRGVRLSEPKELAGVASLT